MTEAQTTQGQPQPCPWCGHRCDTFTGPRKPKPGDLSVCLQCAQPLMIDAGLRLRRMTDAELAALTRAEAKTLQRFMRGIRALDRRR